MLNRSRRRTTSALSLAIGLALTLSACGSGSDSSSGSGGGSKDGSFTVGISNPQGAQPILNVTQDSFIAAAKRDGIEVKTLDAQLDPAKQVTDIDQFVAQKVDLIVVFPLDENALKPALKRADDAGIKVVGWGALSSPKADPGVLATNVETAGKQSNAKLTDYVKAKLGGKGNVLGVGFAIPVPALEMLLRDYKSGVTADSDITWLGRVDNPTDDIAGAQKVVATALTKYRNDVRAITAYSDGSAIGASVAAKAAGLKDVVIVGQNGDDDGIAAVKDGRISATIDLVPWRTGLILETVSKALLEGEKVPSYIDTTAVLYDKANLGDRLAWDTAQSQIADGKLTCANAGCPADVAAFVK